MKESKEISRSELCQMIAELRGAVTSLQQAIKYDIQDGSIQIFVKGK